MRKRLPILVFLLVSALAPVAIAENITLVKHASRLPESSDTGYTVKPGDTMWKIFMRDFDAKTEDLPYLYKRFKELNPHIKDLNHIRIGQKLVMPEMPKEGEVFEIQAASHDMYVIKKGQHLAMILRHVYGVSDEVIFDEYLNLIRELNPELDDVDHIVPGQRIKIPNVKQEERLPKAPDKPVKTLAAGKKAVRKVEKPDPCPVEAESPVAVKREESMAVDPANKPLTEKKRKEVKTKNPVKKAAPKKPADKKEAAPVTAPNVTGAAIPGGSGHPGGPDITAIIRNTLLPAFNDMGGSARESGTYFMPMEGGSSVSIDAGEIPVMELDTGRRVIFDMEGKISPEVKSLLEETFPSCRIVQGPSDDVEGLMDRVLSVSGYFSINKDASPLLVGEAETVKFSGKWIVYKDYSRRNVFVINMLDETETKTPEAISEYASHFGIDLIEIGGRRARDNGVSKDYVRMLNHSMKSLFDCLGIDYRLDEKIELVSMGSLRIEYKAPLLVGKTVYTSEMPDKKMMSFLEKKNYRIMDTGSETIEGILSSLDIEVEGPPVKVSVSSGRTEIALPAVRVDNNIILKTSVDTGIAKYLTSNGMNVLLW